MSDQPRPDVPQIKCPTCPLCGSTPPWIWPGLHQCVCPNEDCDVFMWVPWDTLEENLMDAHRVEWLAGGEETTPDE